MSFTSNVRYIKKLEQKTVTRNQREDGNVAALGHVCRRDKKGETNKTRGANTCWVQSLNEGRSRGEALGAGTTRQPRRGSNGNGQRAGSQRAADNMRP